MLLKLCAVVSAGLLSTVGPGIVEVEVGQEFAVELSFRPETRQLGTDGNALEVAYPPAPYALDFKYDRGLIVFVRADSGAEAAYREVAGSPWAVLTLTTSEHSARAYFRALKVTDKDVRLPVLNVTAAGAPVSVENPDLLRIVPQPAGLVVRLKGATGNGD
jgi:hypothetical protein